MGNANMFRPSECLGVFIVQCLFFPISGEIALHNIVQGNLLFSGVFYDTYNYIGALFDAEYTGIEA